MPVVLPAVGSFQSFAMIVDINGFTELVRRTDPASIAQRISDVLGGCVNCIETAGGEVVEIMGDAILGIFTDAESAAKACLAIAKGLAARSGASARMDLAPARPSLKIGIEYGLLDVAEISSRVLGRHPLIIGEPINHAARILAAGSGNRCLVGPRAREQGFRHYALDGPHRIQGKLGEPDYDYFRLDLSRIWREGEAQDVPAAPVSATLRRTLRQLRRGARFRPSAAATAPPDASIPLGALPPAAGAEPEPISFSTAA